MKEKIDFGVTIDGKAMIQVVKCLNEGNVRLEAYFCEEILKGIINEEPYEGFEPKYDEKFPDIEENREKVRQCAELLLAAYDLQEEVRAFIGKTIAPLAVPQVSFMLLPDALQVSWTSSDGMRGGYVKYHIDDPDCLEVLMPFVSESLRRKVSEYATCLEEVRSFCRQAFLAMAEHPLMFDQPMPYGEKFPENWLGILDFVSCRTIW